MGYVALGLMQYDVGRGVFRRGGHGGGIFDSTISGLGALGVIPAGCWDVTGFKTCHAQQFEVARHECEARSFASRALESDADCIKRRHGELAEIACVRTLCPTGKAITPTAGAVTYPWGVYSEATKALQTQLNAKLKTMGAPLITADGKLGPTTCAALKYAGMMVPTTCQSFGTYPPRATALPPPPVPGVPAAPMYPPTEARAFDTKTIAIVGGAAAALGFVYLYTKKKKGK